MFLLVGLGNPGRKYALNRHNVGFMVVDAFSEGFRRSSKFNKFNSELIKLEYRGKELLLAKPLTFMNNSGSVVASLLSHYKDIESMIVIHDDLDIEFGNIRFKANGSTAGHKGLNSIMSSIGSKDFDRLRIGIGRPPGRKDPSIYVLEDFSKKNVKELELVKVDAVDALKDYISFGIDFAMNKYN